MNKQTRLKIISGLIIFVFILSIFPNVTPVRAASNSGMNNYYSNPNQFNGSNPYKFKISDVVNSSLLTSVVGCTGVVNKVASWMAKFLQSPKKAIESAEAEAKKIRDQLKNACAAGKAALEAVAGAIPFVNNLVSPADTTIETVKFCQRAVDSADLDTLKEAKKALDLAEEKAIKESCFDGIAITLAKNQLTAMTRSAMNWVNTGFGGNPFFVQNMQNLTNSIERNVIETGTDVLLNEAFGSPYSRDFARAKIISSQQYGNGVGAGASSFLGGLQSDLSSFISDPSSYYSDDQLDQAQETRTALQRAEEANSRFQNDFSIGGWDGYMALTQRDQNNPLGFNMMANQFITDTQTKQITEQKAEISENAGFMSQKTCIKWQEYEDGKPKVITADLKVKGAIVSHQDNFVYNSKGPTSDTNHCIDWKTTTPGSIIKDKVTNYLNSPERQLEIAKTINDSLNALFSILISKLQGGGLSGLSDSSAANNSNWIDSLNSDYASVDGNTTYNNNGAYDGFNLTRDLGNTYIHEETFKAGEWNANSKVTNGIKPNETLITRDNLITGYVPPVYREIPNFDDPKNTTNTLISSNLYWTVKTPGDTRIIENGFNGWEEGDRAFWNGYEWQNWKKGQTSPILKRGVIQVQQDYIVAVKEILKVLPNVMPKLGELDYCLPGPNPSYMSNSTEAQTAYQTWVSSAFVGATDSTNKRIGVKIDGPGKRSYDNFQATYTDNPKVWISLLTNYWPITYFYAAFRDLVNYPPASNPQYYHYDSDGEEGMGGTERGHIENRRKYKEVFTEYVSNFWFQEFFKSFGDSMNYLYFNNVTKKYLENELTPVDTSKGSKDENPSYIEMAASGYDLTKDITFYNDEVTKSIKDYTDSMAQAKINISKLESIRAEVSKIIIAAQGRRDANLLLQINKINAEAIEEINKTNKANDKEIEICKDIQNTCIEDERGYTVCYREYTNCIDKLAAEGKILTPTGKILSKEQYKTEYASCLNEENIQVYDADAISNSTFSAERCFNGIDDDLNGLLDIKDPACKDAYKNTTQRASSSFNSRSEELRPMILGADSYCFIDESKTATGVKNKRNTINCLSRSSQSECNSGPYIINNMSYSCLWDPSIANQQTNNST